MTKKTVEEIYQKKTQLEHILLRPDTYIGSVERESQFMYVWDELNKKIIYKLISFVPGLYKIFDEILVNAADNKIRDPTMTSIKVEINSENNTISVLNDGKGVPIRIHSEEKVYVPELIFGQLLTSSNYDDKEKKVTGGRNGYGAKLCNIFSTEFIVETADREVKKYYKQVYKNNMGYTGSPEISKYNDKDFTKITFKPDLKRFKMDRLDEDIVSLLKKRVYDLCGVLKDIKVYLNGQKIEISNFKQYCQLYLNEDSKIIHMRVNNRWELAFTISEEQLQHVAFVNSICTSKGGTHVNHVVEQITEAIIENIKKKHKVTNIRPLQVKSQIFIFINSLIENPAFDSQTKENLTLRVSSFGSKCEPIDKFIAEIIKDTPIIERVLISIKAKENAELKKTDGSKKKRVFLPKLEDAELAGTAKSKDCVLVLTEGDSAKALVMAGRSQIGASILGVFPLRGKMLNVREASAKQVAENKEIIALKQILGLQQNKKYEDVSSLRYGHVMVMTDQDHDGSHIKGLLINFFDYFFPSLLKINTFLQEFITPIVRGRNSRGEVVDFYTMPEYEEFKENHPNYIYKYYKGLGTSTSEDAIEYFSNLEKHVKNFIPMEQNDKEFIDLAFNKKKADQRKTWLLGFEQGTFLDQSVKNISISDFVNKELILFSMADNIRSIPSVVDGFKPGQRKIIFTCFKTDLRKEVKVNILSGTVGASSQYHHGEVSLHSTIIGLAHDFVGSNNINLLLPIGQFGSRLQGGKDSAAARYLNTKLNALSRLIFHKSDDMILNYLNEENLSIEPEYYVPIIPMILINGADGIGTGWSTNIPNYNPKDVIKNIRKMLDDQPLEEMIPYYRNFIGSIKKIESGRFQIDGVWEEEDGEVIISELPIGQWTSVFTAYLDDLASKNIIDGYTSQSSDKTVNLKVQLREKKVNLKLSTTISTNNMVCFDKNLKIKKYDTPEDIIKDFYYVRLTYYMKRKEKLLAVLKENMLKLENKVRFIKEVVNDELIINKRKKSDLIDELKFKEYTEFDNFSYLLSMEILSLTEERIDKLNKELFNKIEEYNVLQGKTPKDLWREDLYEFEIAYDKVVEYEEEVYKKAREGSKSTKGKQKKKKNTVIQKKKTTEVLINDGKRTIKKTLKAEKSVITKKATIKKEKNVIAIKNTKLQKQLKNIKSKDEPVKKRTKTEKKVLKKQVIKLPVRNSIIEIEESSNDVDHAWKKY